LLGAVRNAADTGTAVLLVEQQIKRALAVADRGYVMSHGSIVFGGTRDELAEESMVHAYFS
jgi:branched-chain amino acid transport system ATP-binding protein